MAEYTPLEIVDQLERPLSAGWLAAGVAAFWPTIRAALVEYHERHPEPVKPLNVLD